MMAMLQQHINKNFYELSSPMAVRQILCSFMLLICWNLTCAATLPAVSPWLTKRGPGLAPQHGENCLMEL